MNSSCGSDRYFLSSDAVSNLRPLNRSPVMSLCTKLWSVSIGTPLRLTTHARLQRGGIAFTMNLDLRESARNVVQVVLRQ
jgi:hypothetical protein